MRQVPDTFKHPDLASYEAKSISWTFQLSGPINFLYFCLKHIRLRFCCLHPSTD